VDNIKMDLREIEWNGMDWVGLICLRLGTSWGLLWTRQYTFGFHRMLEYSWVAAQLAASQEGLSSVSQWVTLCIKEANKFDHQSKTCLESHSIQVTYHPSMSS
jgi:hypothetical protein